MALIRIPATVRVLFHPCPAQHLPLVHTNDPSDVLYIRLMKGMTVRALEKIVQHIPGGPSMQAAKTFVKIQFNSSEEATLASEWLWSKTNIYAHYHSSSHPVPNSVPLTSSGQDTNLLTSPSNPLATSQVQSRGQTLHVQNLDRNVAELDRLFRGLGVGRIGFHRDYLFLCFDSTEVAEQAMRYVHQFTSMRARAVKFQYSPHFTPSSLGSPDRIVKMTLATISPQANEMTALFSSHTGFIQLYFTPRKVWAVFDCVQNATACLEYFNERTNLRVVYCTNVKNAVAQQQHQFQQIQLPRATSSLLTQPHPGVSGSGGGGAASSSSAASSSTSGSLSSPASSFISSSPGASGFPNLGAASQFGTNRYASFMNGFAFEDGRGGLGVGISGIGGYGGVLGRDHGSNVITSTHMASMSRPVANTSPGSSSMSSWSADGVDYLQHSPVGGYDLLLGD
ncbi:hypothetical protein HDU76_012979 [Blyttiomyces sp. JEL0837]|nr:hypothetical protein HDU76_012979 [Blyttiomyces sp. JEL0837]